MADEKPDASLDQQITETAQKLGDLVAKHPAIKKLAQAQQALGKDTDATRMLQQFEQKAAVLMRNEQMGQPVGDAERRELEAMQQQIASNIKVKAFSIAQTDMTDLLRKVSQTWQRPVAEAQGGDDESGAASNGPGLSMQ